MDRGVHREARGAEGSGQMRVNIYAEEMTERVEIISKTIDGRSQTATQRLQVCDTC